MNTFHFVYLLLKSSFFCTQPYQMEIIFKHLLDSVGIGTPDQNGPGCNGNDGVLHTPQISRTGASPSDSIRCHTQET